MSSKSIALFDTHRNSSGTTLPAPPSTDPAADLLKQARKYHARASRALAKALELEAMAEFLGGKHGVR